jgi:N6-adenosine-specific RNA methylase IME4
MKPQYHPLAELFPMMNESEFASLRSDMRVHGYDADSPVILFDGKILDGRNRHEAALAEGLAPVYRDYTGDQPLEYVLRCNLKRRHLTESQRAIVAGRIANMSAGRPSNNSANLQSYPVSQAAAAEMMGVSTRTVASAKAVERTAPELLEKIASGEMSVHEAQGVIRRGANADRISKLAARPIAPLENGKRYHVIYADPPWQYEHPISESRKIENQYPTMSLDDIVALPVSSIAADDSILFLWVTTPMARKGFAVMEAWGFEYRTGMVWVKPSIGMGQWVRQRHELMYIGTRGKIPTPAAENKPDSVLEAPRLDHSQKPEEMYSIIESMYPDLLRVELFARVGREGWDSWGNQV